MLTDCLREFYYVPDIIEYVEGAVGAVRNVNCSTRCARKSLHRVSGYSGWDVTWCFLTSPCPHLYSPAGFTCVSRPIGNVLCPGLVRILSWGRLFTIVPQCFMEKMIFGIVTCICFLIVLSVCAMWMCTNDKSLCKIVVCPATLKLRMSYTTRVVENKPTFRAQLIIELSKPT